VGPHDSATNVGNAERLQLGQADTRRDRAILEAHRTVGLATLATLDDVRRVAAGFASQW